MNYYKYNDYELLYLIEEEDEFAYQILHKKYMPYIYRKASNTYKKLSTYDCEELSFDDLIITGEETLYRCSKSYSDQKEAIFMTFFSICLDRAYLGYIRKIFTNKIKIFHYDEKDYEVEDVLSLEKEWKNSSFVLCEQYEKERNIYNFMIDLEGMERYVFELYYNGFRYKEISTLLEITVYTVGRFIQNLRKKLKKKLKKNIM